MTMIAALLLIAAPEPQLPAASTDQTARVFAVAPKPAKKNSKSCREMLLSSSRLGAIKVCKTRAEWRKWDSCHSSVTRYCTPQKKADRLYSEWKNDRIVCKDIRETGSRIRLQRVCSTAREWRLAEEEAQKALRDRQSMSTLTGGSEELSITRPQ